MYLFEFRECSKFTAKCKPFLNFEFYKTDINKKIIAKYLHCYYTELLLFSPVSDVINHIIVDI